MSTLLKALHRILVLTGCGLPGLAAAQQPAPAPQQSSSEWAKLPKMVLERQYAGPLQDTVIQRLRDPADGTVCYVYLPISVAHTPPTNSGFVQYGSNGVGSVSCIPPAPAAAAPPGKR